MLYQFWCALANSSSAITALTAIVQTVIIIIAAGLAIKQLRDGVRARSLDGFRAISEELNREDARLSRQFIYSHNIAPADLTAEERSR